MATSDLSLPDAQSDRLLFPPPWRKLALVVHVTSSVAWLGAVLTFAVLSIAGVTSRDAATVRSAYVAMNLIGEYAIVPLSIAALITGVIQALGTQWGLFRHYWVLVKLALTVGATSLLMLHQFGAVSVAAQHVLAVNSSGLPDVGRLGNQLVFDSVLAALVLLVTTTLSIYKPAGVTPYGWRKQRERAAGIARTE